MDNLTFKTSMSFAYGQPAPMGPGIVRLVAHNPSPFTFKGTNTYLIGSTSLAVIDPGPDSAEHREAILRAAGKREITHIFSTHAHRDHVDGIASLKAVTGAKICAMKRTPSAVIPIENTPQGTDFVDLSLAPDLDLKAGDCIEGNDWALTAIHTPGHAPDHLCFALEKRDVVFSGDHVMAWNTSVIAPPEGRMSDYVRSLEILLDRSDTVFLPGHGGRLEEPQRTVKAYLLHRRWREQAILKALKDGAGTIRAIVPEIYPAIASPLVPAATLTVLAHVEHLLEKGQISAARPLTADEPLLAV